MTRLLIPNIRRAWRLLTIWVGVIAVAFGLLPVAQQTAVLEAINLHPDYLPATLGLMFILARLLRQPGALHPPRKRNRRKVLAQPVKGK